MDIAFWGSRYDGGVTEKGGFINYPFTEEDYYQFVTELTNAARNPLRENEQEIEIGFKAVKRK